MSSILITRGFRAPFNRRTYEMDFFEFLVLADVAGGDQEEYDPYEIEREERYVAGWERWMEKERKKQREFRELRNMSPKEFLIVLLGTVGGYGALAWLMWLCR